MPSAAAISGPPPLSRREILGTWGTAVGALAAAAVVASFVPLLRANLAGVAAFLFIAVPDSRLRARGEDWTEYGVPFYGLRDPRTWRDAGRGALAALGVAAVVFPVFLAGFWAYAEVLPRLPAGLARALAPYAGAPRLVPRAPPGLPVAALVQLLVVALPEEMFYRGFVQTALARTAPARGVRILGARLGAGFVLTQALFALGHLVVLRPWRLGTFFPGLLFGWLRERTGGIAGPVVLHALSNLFIATLEASFFGS